MRRLMISAALTSLTLFAGQTARAESAEPPAAAAKPAAAAAVTPAPPQLDAFEQAMAASRVADFGRRQKDPHALIVAARMLQEIPMQDGAEAADPTAPPPPFSAEALFDEAKVLAKGDAQLLMQINLAQNADSRGVLSSMFGAGLVRIVRDVSGRQVFAFPIKAKGGELLRIGAIGDARTEIGMRLRDKAGKLLCDVSGDFAPVCSIRPKNAGDFKVEVLNRGSAATRAVILSN